LIEEIGYKMKIAEFCQARPFLYHMTDKDNLPLILKDWALLSTKRIAYAAFDTRMKANDFLKTKRDGSESLIANGKTYKIRDQHPISLTVLKRSLSGGLKTGDFLKILNERVFWWPSIKRLVAHFDRYK